MPEYKYIDTTDLPSDVNGSLGKFRVTLLRAFNENRNSEDKMLLLRDTLRYVLAEIQSAKKRDVLRKDDSVELAAKLKSESNSKPKRAAQRIKKETN